MKELDNPKKHIRDIMKAFDFETVHRVMTFLDWKWVRPGGATVPPLEDIKATAEHHLRTVAELGSIESRSGGFIARRDVDGETGTVFLELEFYVDCESSL